MKCRLCGYLANNAVTNLCMHCDSVVAWGLGEVRRRNMGHFTLEQAKRGLHEGRISQDDYSLFWDVWAVSAVRLSIDVAQVRDALERLEESANQEAEDNSPDVQSELGE